MNSRATVAHDATAFTIPHVLFVCVAKTLKAIGNDSVRKRRIHPNMSLRKNTVLPLVDTPSFILYGITCDIEIVSTSIVGTQCPYNVVDGFQSIVTTMVVIFWIA